ncbi:hypothetical protein PFISCL1PPCAC_7972, partial [Pristionchus fissidentatus]
SGLGSEMRVERSLRWRDSSLVSSPTCMSVRACRGLAERSRHSRVDRLVKRRSGSRAMALEERLSERRWGSESRWAGSTSRIVNPLKSSDSNSCASNLGREKRPVEARLTERMPSDR